MTPVILEVSNLSRRRLILEPSAKIIQLNNTNMLLDYFTA